MKRFIKTISVIMTVIIAASVFPACSSADYVELGFNCVEFGSYPQTIVTDDNLLSELNKLNLNWKSYGYYSGTDIYDDGEMLSSDYMRYADVKYHGNKYRAVTFDTYRPTFTGYSSTETAETYQDNNGYICNNTYWFIFEPLKWRVTDSETGYLISDLVIDSQPFSNFLSFNGSAYYMDDKGWDYSNYYVNSSIRKWLNSDFLNTAFTEEEQKIIIGNHMDDFYVDIEDKIFLPSANEMKNTDWWKDDASRIATGTDYAKCQGLFTENGNSYWRLRNAADWSQYVCGVCPDGTLYSYPYYYRIYPYQTSFTGTGVRPAIKLGNLSDSSLKINSSVAYVDIPDADNQMNFSEKIRALFDGIKSIVTYFFSSADSLNESALSVMDSLGRGINVPCMEDGWAREWALERETYSNIRNEGFNYIRLPANLVCMLDSDGTFNESAANNLDRVINYAMDAGLCVILDLHGWQALNDNPSAENIETIVSVWKQLSERYKDYPSQLMFQIYNEPNNSSGKMSDIRWNYIQNKVTAAIRDIDEDRIIVLSSKNYNVSSSLSDMLYNRKDKYIVIDVHNYSPMEFTHQGAEWIDGYDKIVPYTDEAKTAFEDAIKVAADFRDKNGTKIIIGEFGVYLRQTEKADVTAFLTDAVTVMEENGFAWAYWEYYAGFGAYDSETKEWKDFVIDGLMCNK